MNWKTLAGERLMKCSFVFAALGAASIVFAGPPDDRKGTLTQPPPPPSKPVTETLWGQKVTDDYRYMENLGPETVDWMKKEGAYTRRLFDSIAPRAALGKRVADFSGSFDAIQDYASYGG